LAVRRLDRGRLHLGRIGSDAGLGQRERGDRAFRKPWEILLLLLGRTEKFERLRNADRLMRGQPGHGRTAPRGNEADGAVVVRGAEPEASVLFRDLHAPGAELVQTVEQRVVVVAL